MTDSAFIRLARKLGAERGQNDAAFALAEGQYGEPRPPLSGEFADDPTPVSLAREIGLRSAADLFDVICSEYEDAYYDAWEAACPKE
jgi:hypothetical protein